MQARAPSEKHVDVWNMFSNERSVWYLTPFLARSTVRSITGKSVLIERRFENDVDVGMIVSGIWRFLSEEFLIPTKQLLLVLLHILSFLFDLLKFTFFFYWVLLIRLDYWIGYWIRLLWIRSPPPLPLLLNLITEVILTIMKRSKAKIFMTSLKLTLISSIIDLAFVHRT